MNVISVCRAASAAAFVFFAGIPVAAGVAQAADQCPRPDALGTSRELVVDPATYPRVGLKSFPQTLPLEDKEVVLTFDDGPQPATTHKVLSALKAECVKATFFIVGQNTRAYPQLVREIAADGHSIGNHTMTHPMLDHRSFAAAVSDIDQGFAADEAALGVSRTVPFFRFPYFASTPELLDLMEKRGIVVFGTDLWASDWEPLTPDQELRLVTSRLAAAGRGIILLHDAQRRTATMLPAFLAYLKRERYRIVHVVPAQLSGPAKAPENPH